MIVLVIVLRPPSCFVLAMGVKQEDCILRAEDKVKKLCRRTVTTNYDLSKGNAANEPSRDVWRATDTGPWLLSSVPIFWHSRMELSKSYHVYKVWHEQWKRFMLTDWRQQQPSNLMENTERGVRAAGHAMAAA